MPLDAIPCPPTLQVSQAEAGLILQRLKRALPSTGFVAAAPSPVCGMTAVTLENGNTAFVDKTGRYFILGLLVDTGTGKTVDGTLELRDK